jgi:hypothetical protein
MTQDPTAASVPAGLNGNGGTSHAKRTADGVAALAGMLPQLAQMLGSALSQLPQATAQAVAQSVPRQLCAQCVLARVTWEARHAQEMAGASAEYQQAATEAAQQGIPLQKPPEAFLPERLHPGQPDGIPPVQPGITTVNGTLVCAGHIPGAPGKPGAKALLIAHGPLSSAMLSSISG